MIYENIVRLCSEKGITVATLEKEAGIGNGIVHNWRHRSIPRVDTLKKVADYFGVSVDTLISDEIGDSLRKENTPSGRIVLKVNGEDVLGDEFRNAEELARKVFAYYGGVTDIVVTVEMGQKV